MLSTYVFNQATFIQLLKGELTDNRDYSHFYQTHNDNGQTKKLITINSGQFQSMSIKEDFKCEYDVTITNSRILDFKLFNGHFNSLSFNNVQFESLEIAGGSYSKLYISGTIENSSYIKGGVFESLYFGDTSFKDLSFSGGIFAEIYFSGIKCKSIFFRGGSYDMLRVAGGAEANDCLLSGLYFCGGNFNQAAIFGLSNIEKCYVTSGSIGNLTIQSEGLKNILIDGSLQNYSGTGESISNTRLEVNNLSIQQLSKISISIKDIDFKTINFSNSYFNKDSVFRLSNTGTESLTFDNFVNYGLATFNNLRINTGNSFNIKYSDLGKTTFINCQFYESEFVFESSRLTDVFISGTKMPERIIGVSNEEQRLGYAQIKKIYDSRGDSVGYTRFFSNEMNAYHKTLSFKDNIWDYINLSLNKYSTDHGQSWKRGFLSLLSFGILSYWIYIYLIGFCLTLNINAEHINLFTKVSSYFFDYLNPVHKTDSIVESLSLNNGISTISFARVWEGLSRIIIAYLLYQFVQAFRKFGRK